MQAYIEELLEQKNVIRNLPRVLDSTYFEVLEFVVIHRRLDHGSRFLSFKFGGDILY